MTDFFEFPEPTTTAIYPNRVKDKAQVESALGLREKGDDVTKFYTDKGNLFAIGYNRVVYGDHGPYVEFERKHIKISLLKKFNLPDPADIYYVWLLPSDGSNLKVYDQKRDVKHLKNPPMGGFCGNRSEGYADYVPGKLYVNPFLLTVH